MPDPNRDLSEDAQMSFEEGVYVSLSVEQVSEVMEHFGMEPDDPHLLSAGSGPGKCTYVLHPTAGDEDADGWPQRLDVLSDSEEELEVGLEEVRSFVLEAGGAVRE